MLHVTDIVHFPFPDFPHFKLLVGALEELYHLGVFVEDTDVSMIGKRTELTEIGQLMSNIPVLPKYSRALIAAADLGCSEEVCAIVSLLGEPGNVFHTPRTKKKEADAAHALFYDETGDHMTLLKVIQQYEPLNKGARKEWARLNFMNPRPLDSALRSKRQLTYILQKAGKWSTSPGPHETRSLYCRICTAFLTGGFMQVARQDNDKYQIIINKTTADIVKYSAIKFIKPADTKWILFDEFINTGDDDAFRTVTVIHPKWCIDAVPSYFVPANFPEGPIRNELEVALRQHNAEKYGGIL